MKSLNILIVEDDAIIGDLLADLLAEMGHFVFAIETTESGAVAAAARHRPDLMIVDAQLGEGSGLLAMDAILRSGPAPHIFVSGNLSKVSAHRPASISLQKPYSEKELTAAIERALESR